MYTSSYHNHKKFFGEKQIFMSSQELLQTSNFKKGKEIALQMFTYIGLEIDFSNFIKNYDFSEKNDIIIHGLTAYDLTECIFEFIQENSGYGKNYEKLGEIIIKNKLKFKDGLKFIIQLSDHVINKKISEELELARIKKREQVKKILA